MTSLSILSELKEPWILQTYDSSDELMTQIKSQMPEGTNIVVLEGNKMTNLNDFYVELIHKLKLPDYFGCNLDALDECMNDLEWLDEQPLVMIFNNPTKILISNRKLFDGFIDVVRNACKEWSTDISEGLAWDRSAVPLHLIFNFQNLDNFNRHLFPTIELV